MKQHLKLIRNVIYIWNSGVTVKIEEKEEVKVELPTKEEILARRKAANEEAPQLKINKNEEAGAEADKQIDVEEVMPASGKEEVIPDSGKEEVITASVKEEEKKQPPVVAQNIVEEPILSEFAQNNYWRGEIQYNIKELENEYA